MSLKLELNLFYLYTKLYNFIIVVVVLEKQVMIIHITYHCYDVVFLVRNMLFLAYVLFLVHISIFETIIYLFQLIILLIIIYLIFFFTNYLRIFIFFNSLWSKYV